MVASFEKKVFQIRSNCMNEKLITSIVSKSLHNQSFIKFKCLEIFFRYFARTHAGQQKGKFLFSSKCHYVDDCIQKSNAIATNVSYNKLCGFYNSFFLASSFSLTQSQFCA